MSAKHPTRSGLTMSPSTSTSINADSSSSSGCPSSSRHLQAPTSSQTTGRASKRPPSAIATILTEHGTITPASSSHSSSPVLPEIPRETTTGHQSKSPPPFTMPPPSEPSEAVLPATSSEQSKGLQLFKCTASEVIPCLKSGEVSVEDYARSLLERIDSRDELVGAWAYLDRDRVIKEARRLDGIPVSQRGPLHGVPVAVKDVIYTKDMPTMHNSPLYINSFPEVDAACVRLLRHAGALIFGKTTTTEFAAMFHGPPTRNPHSLPPHPIRTPGGSSSGSGAAVGDFQAPIALATQTGGSTIRPASFNGIYGLKPTWGAISREGSKFYSVTLDTVGLYARSAGDIDVLADVVGLHDDDVEGDSQAGEDRAAVTFARGESIKGKKFAVCKTSSWSSAGEGTQKAMAKAADLLRTHGAIVEEITLPTTFDQLAKWHKTLLQTEGRPNFLPEYRVAQTVKDSGSELGVSNSVRQASVAPERRPLLNELIVEHVENAHGYSHKDQLKAMDGAAGLRPMADEILGGYVAVLAPSVPDEAPLGNDTTGNAVFCSGWTLLHTPVMNIPGFEGVNGLPIGVSLVAPRFRDRHLIRVSKTVGAIFEAEGGWQRKNL